MFKVINVGGGATRFLPPNFKGWEQVLLDLDPTVKPDLLCDAREMHKLPRAKFDAVYCSHALEHFYQHDVPKVLSGFNHVLRPSGFVQIAVPDLKPLFKALANGSDLSDTWYRVGMGNISYHDVLYGWGLAVERGSELYQHKTGFTDKILTKTLQAAKFSKVYTASDGFNLHAFAFKQPPNKALRAQLGI